MSYSEKEQLFHAYLDDELDERERVEAEAHLARDEEARAELRFYGRMRQKLRETPKAMPSVAFVSRLQSSIAQEKKRDSQEHFSVFRMVGVAAMACGITTLIFFSRFWLLPPTEIDVAKKADLPSSRTPSSLAREEAPVSTGAVVAPEERAPAQAVKPTPRHEPVISALPAATGVASLPRCERTLRSWIRQGRLSPPDLRRVRQKLAKIQLQKRQQTLLHTKIQQQKRQPPFPHTEAP